MAAYRTVNERKLKRIIGRLCKPTVAATAATWGFDTQDCHLGKKNVSYARSDGEVNSTVGMESTASHSQSITFRRSQIQIVMLNEGTLLYGSHAPKAIWGTTL